MAPKNNISFGQLASVFTGVAGDSYMLVTSGLRAAESIQLSVEQRLSCFPTVNSARKQGSKGKRTRWQCPLSQVCRLPVIARFLSQDIPTDKQLCINQDLCTWGLDILSSGRENHLLVSAGAVVSGSQSRPFVPLLA